ncbi:hypothetical protein [Corynebacterium durum]|nr:hypothetical protein [Corynebacterium durum]MDO4652172.1 hypothetical protein [Corynebacterium durum]
MKHIGKSVITDAELIRRNIADNPQLVAITRVGVQNSSNFNLLL